MNITVKRTEKYNIESKRVSLDIELPSENGEINIHLATQRLQGRIYGMVELVEVIDALRAALDIVLKSKVTPLPGTATAF